jgi:NADPH:quinone reductase
MKELAMRASQFSTFGGPEALSTVDLPDPSPTDGQALIRIEAASINPSDVKNVAGAMSQTTLPRVPGRDYAGVVEHGPAEWIGAKVWGTGGDVGFTRDGTHAQRIAVPVEALSRMPASLSFPEAASVGVNFLVAWQGLIEAAAIVAGETLLTIGAGGGVGGAVAQIARHVGARVIGADRAPPPAGSAILDIADVLLTEETDLQSAVRQANDGRGADVVYDCVGGKAMFATALDCLAHRGRLVEISATGGREVQLDLADFYHNESRLFGVDSLKRDLVQSARMLDLLRPQFEDGTFRPAPVAATYLLDASSEAYRRVAAGAPGRIVLTPNA